MLLAAGCIGCTGTVLFCNERVCWRVSYVYEEPVGVFGQTERIS
jgi:hypothetical protein